MTEEEDKKEAQRKYLDTPEGKESLKRAQRKYDDTHPEERRIQKRDYMRRKRQENPDYGRDIDQ
jgi:hypothetical protein